MTPEKIADVRLKCLEIFVTTGAKFNLDNGSVFEFARQGADFVLKGLDENQQGQAKAPKGK